jgi:hypothetical protein
MEASEESEILVNGEPVLTPDPNFGIGWPDDVRLLCARLFSYEETGLVDGSGDHVTLVERAVVPNLPKGS